MKRSPCTHHFDDPLQFEQCFSWPVLDMVGGETAGGAWRRGQWPTKETMNLRWTRNETACIVGNLFRDYG